MWFIDLKVFKIILKDLSALFENEWMNEWIFRTIS